jgi:hypothetical protein
MVVLEFMDKIVLGSRFKVGEPGFSGAPGSRQSLQFRKGSRVKNGRTNLVWHGDFGIYLQLGSRFSVHGSGSREGFGAWGVLAEGLGSMDIGGR